MRCLVDENMSPAVAAVLRFLGHDAQHINDIGWATSRDEDYLPLAVNRWDLLITKDLFRGKLEREVARRAMLDGLMILHLRIPGETMNKTSSDSCARCCISGALWSG